MTKIVFYTLVIASMAWVGDVSAVTTLTYQYDANGNMISGEGKYYEYNDANQLVRLRLNNATGPVIAAYFYDYNGQRIKKVENGITTYYIGKQYETLAAGGNKANTSYYFANGERVAKKDPAGQMFYYHFDHLGSTNAVTDATGTMVGRTKYYPFGEVREGGNEKYSYTGKEKDTQSDWYYYEARYYNPQFKHFTQADTVVHNYYYPQDLNRYSYVRNNPLKYIDPTGHFSWNPREWLKYGKEKASSAVQSLKDNVSSIRTSATHYLLDPLPADSGWLKFDSFMRNKVNPYMIKASLGTGISIPNSSHLTQGHSVSLVFDGRYGSKTPSTINYSLSLAASTNASPSFHGVTASFQGAYSDAKTTVSIPTPIRGLDVGIKNQGVEFNLFGVGKPEVSISQEVYSKDLVAF